MGGENRLWAILQGKSIGSRVGLVIENLPYTTREYEKLADTLGQLKERKCPALIVH
jgi:hypothetical protein